MSHFQDKVAIVTGGASGLGKALCHELAQRGAKVIVLDIDIGGAKSLADSISENYQDAYAIELDATDTDAVTSALEEIAATQGSIDFMFNNAGMGMAAEVRDISIEDWKKIIDLNLFGVIHGTAAAYFIMLRQGKGHIVNIASFAGLVGLPTATPYSTSKFAVVGLSTALRAEAADLGVKVSVACPGNIKTPFFDSATVMNVDRKKVFDLVPGKMMTPEKAATKILDGVQRNQAVIVFPFPVRLLWWLHRINPALTSPLAKRLVKGFRNLRGD